MGIRENIKRLREMYDLTQQDLADIAGVTNKAVSAWESGLSEPRKGPVERISRRFGIKKSNLIEDGGMDNLDLFEHAAPRNLSDIEFYTIAAHRAGYEGPVTEKEIEQIKLALKIALAKDNT